MNPLKEYERAVEELRREPSEAKDLHACRLHAERLRHVWLSPWWAKAWRRRRLNRALRRHVGCGPGAFYRLRRLPARP